MGPKTHTTPTVGNGIIRYLIAVPFRVQTKVLTMDAWNEEIVMGAGILIKYTHSNLEFTSWDMHLTFGFVKQHHDRIPRHSRNEASGPNRQRKLMSGFKYKKSTLFVLTNPFGLVLLSTNVLLCSPTDDLRLDVLAPSIFVPVRRRGHL